MAKDLRYSIEDSTGSSSITNSFVNIWKAFEIISKLLIFFSKRYVSVWEAWIKFLDKPPKTIVGFAKIKLVFGSTLNRNPAFT